MAGDYWCEECQRWIDSGEVTETSEETKPGAPMRTKYEHNLCGMEVQKAQTEDEGPR
ncbi:MULTISPECIES: hypothetical protein [Haloferax]|uniref:Uncharacterized protein n=1 Tax=Haloferax volcanii TaxID=2246 RepID=A0A8T5CUF1_HALVO|nr:MULTISPECIES: hypothetical protein [Haloferax]MBS8117861.1 hypothetical protein [Haloferax volcanii]MBS8122873.1 hypothetical protein [Haloferax volcanii]MBS8126741.1 hypothetical protein [Haloferax volcanii]MBS8130607.1 hypothetical protein [Haloferax volcanii]MDW7539316.1 hypothetical protein [Haloferax volcanii]